MNEPQKTPGATKEPSVQTKVLKTLRVSVKRKQETIAAEVFEHEIDILRTLHLYENVNVTDENYGELTVPNDAELELRRLRAKYDRKNAEIVAKVYRTPSDVARASGLKVQQQRGQRAPASGIRNTLRGPHSKEAAAA
jgi:hypothetical protein